MKTTPFLHFRHFRFVMVSHNVCVDYIPYGLLCGGKPLRDAVRPALLLGVAKPLRALLAALCYYGLPLLAVLYFPLSGAYLVLLGFSLPFLLGHFYIRTVLRDL